MAKFLGMLAFLICILALYYLVPRDKIKEYNTFGLLAGPILGVILLYFMSSLYGFWRFGPLDFFILGIPIFMALVWYPLEVGFAYYFTNSSNNLMYLAIVLFLPTLASLSHLVLRQYGLLSYQNWSLLATFIQSLIIHSILGAYLYYRLKNPL
jgi:hypothetical protein